MCRIILFSCTAVSNNTVFHNHIDCDKGVRKYLLLPDNKNCLPIGVTISVGKTTTCSNGAKLVLIDKQNYLLIPEFSITKNTPVVIRQEHAFDYLFTIYNDSNLYLVVENDSHYYSTILPENIMIDELQFSYTATPHPCLIIHNSTCLIMLDKTLNLIFKGGKVDYQPTNEGCVINYALTGYALRNITEQYSHYGELTARAINYLIPPSCPPKLLPYAFFEAIMCGDYAYADNLLSDDIKNSLDEIIGYLGIPDKICIAPPPVSDHNLLILQYGYTYKVCKCDYANKINNFDWM